MWPLLAACRQEPVRSDPPQDPTGPENVLLVVLDDVGNDRMSPYRERDDAPELPTLQHLADEGVLFRNAWASPVCTPSRAMLLTGRFTRRYGVGKNFLPQADTALPLPEELIPEMLARADAPWSSLALGKWHLASDSNPRFDAPLRQGFDHFVGTPGNLTESELDPREGGDYYHWERVVDGVRGWRNVYATTDLTDTAIQALPKVPEPWFVYLAYNAPHAPWEAPPASLDPDPGTSPADLYDASLIAVDAELGRLLSSLDPEVRARTTIVVVGDNGTPSEVLRRGEPRDESKLSMFEGGVNVPMIVAGPDVAHPGSESDALVHLVDVFPTVADLAGVDVDPDELDGESLLPYLRDPDRAGPPFVYTERLARNSRPPWPRERSAIRDERYKLIVELGGVEHLYDLRGRDDEGPDLLAGGALDADAGSHLAALRGARAQIRARAAFAYDGY